MQLETWDDVDNAVRRMGELDIALERIQGDLQLSINTLKDQAKARSLPFIDERKALEKQVQLYCEERKDEFVKKRSRVLTYGTIGYRLVRSVSLPRVKDKVAALLKALKAYGLQECIRVEETPLRERIEELDEATIAKLGLRRTVTDSFRIQPDLERLADVTEAA